MEKPVIDSHFHSSYLASFDLKDTFGIDVGTVFDDLPQRVQNLQKYPNVRLSAAMGPWECGKSRTKEETDVEKYGFRSMDEVLSDFDKLLIYIDKYNPAFIGECGLDYYWDYGTRDMQRELFEKHMLLAKEMDKPIIIHNREADKETAEIILKHTVKTGIIHCFSGDKELMYTALDCGFFISFAGNLTYKKNSILRDRLREVPKERLLLETDSPYLTPVPFRGQANTPDKVLFTYKCAAETLNIPLEQLKETIYNNYNNLLSYIE